MSAWKRLRRARGAGERGVIALEFVGTFGLVLAMVLIVWQGMLAMHALSEANYAARDAARAEVMRSGTGPSAGQNALSAHLQDTSFISCSSSTGAVTCEAEVDIPLIASSVIGDGVHGPSVTRSATMPAVGEVD